MGGQKNQMSTGVSTRKKWEMALSAKNATVGGEYWQLKKSVGS